MFSSRRSHLALLSVVGEIAAAAFTAPGASAAAQRYASPTGTGGDCSAEIPCTILTAVAGATAGDEVIVASGDYGLSTAINAPSQITIHGVAGQQRPRLQFSSGAWLQLNDSTLRYMAIDQTYATARAVTTAGG